MTGDIHGYSKGPKSDCWEEKTKLISQSSYAI